jgi:hypothetical protein
MSQQVDLRGIGSDEHCEDIKEVASKVGVQVVCNDEDATEQENENALHLPDSEGCADTKEVASRFGVQVVCDDEEK